MSARSLVVKVTAGKDDPERCNQAFTVAATAAASGVTVSLWLTGEAAWFSLPGRAAGFALPHAAPLPDLLAGILAAGTVTVCTQCAARRDITPGDLLAGVRIAGAATFVAEVMADGAQALVY
jgi:predicted peroxiredoxin